MACYEVGSVMRLSDLVSRDEDKKDFRVSREEKTRPRESRQSGPLFPLWRYGPARSSPTA